MTWQAAFGLSLLIGVPCYFAGFVVRGMFPRVNPEQEEEPVGDFPYSSHVMKDGL
jgi:hypothetical protein